MEADLNQKNTNDSSAHVIEPNSEMAVAAAAVAPASPRSQIRLHAASVGNYASFRQRLPSRSVCVSGSGGAHFAGTWIDRAEVRGAAVRGLTHAHDGAPGEDAAMAAYAEDVLVLAVADGVGNSINGASASRAAVEAIAAALLQPAGPGRENGVEHYIAAAQSAILCLGSQSGATTLALASIELSNTRGNADLFVIGDSSVWQLRGEELTEVLTDNYGKSPDSANATRALPRHIDPRCGRLELLPGDILFLATDGFSNGLRFVDPSIRDAVKDRWTSPPDALELYSLLDYRMQDHIDDRAFAGLWLPPEDT